MGPFWKYINILSLILIILLAGYVAYNRSTANQMEIEDPTVMQPTKPAEGLFSKIKQLLFPDKQVVNTPIDNKPLLKQPEPEPMPRLEVPMELQEHLPKIQRQPMVTGPGFVAGTEVMVNMPVVTEKIWQEGHWIGLEVGPLTPALAQANGIPQGIKGVLVDEVTLLAAASGIIAGDVITAINDKATGDLYAFKEATRPIAMSNRAVVTVYRGGQYKRIDVISNEELGLAQMEAAPMINATDPSPHGYYGACEKCHAIAKTVKNTGQMAKDGGDVLTKKAPPIKWGVKAPHGNRGVCVNCHTVI